MAPKQASIPPFDPPGGPQDPSGSAEIRPPGLDAGGRDTGPKAREARRRRSAVDLLCKVAGVPDLATWLDLEDGYTPRDALSALEKKRRSLEKGLSDPRTAREAEVVFAYWADIRAALLHAQAGAPDAPARAGAPVDHYAVLGVQPTASFLAIERAYQALKATGSADARVEQAWRVLGDPLNRAQFDRARRHGAVRTAPDLSEATPTAHDVEKSSSGMALAEIPGPDLREIHLEDDQPTVRPIAIVVRGSGTWKADIDIDHPCLSTTPSDAIRASEGRHTIAVRIDPSRLTRAITTCTVTLSSHREQHIIALRIHRAPARRGRAREIGLALGAAALVGVGWLIGQQTTLQTTERLPASVGKLDQIPSIRDCFPASAPPLPAWVDIHVDGLGRPTGFHIEGPARPSAETCVRDALRRLEFPPTPRGLPAYHRYRLPDLEVTP